MVSSECQLYSIKILRYIEVYSQVIATEGAILLQYGLGHV